MNKGISMSDIASTTETENAFEAPQATLTEANSIKPILEMERFSTWGVFFLCIITFGIYYLYWFISRGNKINTLAKKSKVKMNMMYIYLGLYFSSVLFTTIAPENTTFVLVGSLLSLVSLVTLFIAIFSFRRVIEEVASVGSSEPVKLGGVLTFFFSAFYFPYKINEAIDKQSK